MIEKFTFDIVSPKISRKLILVKNVGERREHIVLKLISYILFYEDRLKIEPDLGTHYKPDLAVEGEHGVAEVWIDCGQISLEKAEKLSKKARATRLIFVKESLEELIRFKATVDKKAEHADRIEYMAFDSGVISHIANQLDRSNEWTLYDVDDNTIGITFGDNVFETHVHRMARTAPPER